MLIGVGEGFNVIASDALAMLQATNQYKEIHDHEIVIVKRDDVIIKDINGQKYKIVNLTLLKSMLQMLKGCIRSLHVKRNS